MMGRIAEASPRLRARIAGGLCFVIAAAGMLAGAFVHEPMVVHGEGAVANRKIEQTNLVLTMQRTNTPWSGSPGAIHSHRPAAKPETARNGRPKNHKAGLVCPAFSHVELVRATWFVAQPRILFTSPSAHPAGFPSVAVISLLCFF